MQIRYLFLNISNTFLFLLLFFASKAQIINTGNIPLGGFKSQKTAEQELQIQGGNGFLTVKVYSPNIIRIQVSKQLPGVDFSYAVIGNPQVVKTNIKEEGNNIVLTTDSLKLIITKDKLQVSFFNNAGELINGDDEFGTMFTGNEISCYKKLFPDERFIGLGEKTGDLNRRGNGYVNWNTDVFGYGPGTDPMYVSIPFYIGLHDSLCYGIFLDNTSKTHFNFGASNMRFSSFTVEEGDLNYYFIYHSGVEGIITSYTDLTGKTPMPAQWSLGFQQCRWSYFPDTEVLTVARTFREKQIPLDVIYLDIHYMDSYKIFTWDKIRFPQPVNMLNTLKGMGVRTAIIVDPGIKVEKGYTAYEEGIKNDLFLKYPDGTKYAAEVWPGLCNFPDFTLPETRNWWGNSFKNYVDEGIIGFWNDMNEPATWGQKFPSLVEFNYDGNGGNGLTGRNIYGMQMARSTYEGTKKLLVNQRPFVLTRSGYAGIQRYSTVWTGDNTPTDDHLLLGVRLLNSLGLSGVANCGVDVGGFAADATKELYTRWITLGVFTPFFRSHKAYNLKDSEPWSYGEETEAIAKYYIQLRYQLMPYLYSAFYQANITGLPVNRSLAIDHPYDAKIYYSTYQNQYLFGDAMLIAPVRSTENFCKVYFPAHDYYDFYNDEKFNANTEVIVESPLHRLPVFVKESSIIPMQRTVQNFDQKPTDTLFVHVYYGKINNEITYYEDDGVSYNMESGVFYKRNFIYSSKEKSLTISKVEGTYISQFKTIQLVFHGFDPAVTNILVDGKKNTFTNTKKNMLFPEEAYKILYFANRDKAVVQTINIPNSNNKIVLSW